MEYPPASIVAVSIILPLLALLAVFLRFYVRLRLQPSHIGIDDWLIVGAVILALADGANLAAAAILGIQGRDYPDEIPPDRALFEARSDYAQVIIEKPLYGMMKLSVLFFFRRIFLVQKTWRIANNILIAVIIAWTIAFFFADIFICGPHPKVQWMKGAKNTCVQETWLNLSFAITDVIGDILVVTMPYPCIKKLNMGGREKFGIVSIFLLGTLSTAASIVRLGFISVAVQAVVSPAGGKHENGTPPAVWSTVEAAVGVLAACLPPLGPLIRKAPSPRKASATIIGKIVSKTSGRRNSESGLDADRKASSRLTPAPVAHSHIVQLHPAARDAYIELEDRMV